MITNFREEEVPWETVEHISSSGCKSQKEVVTLAHNNVFPDLMFSSVARHQKGTSDREFTTIGCEKPVGSLLQMKEYTSICSKEELWDAVAYEEAKTH